MRPLRRTSPILVVLGLAGLCAGCFEPPVAERMLLEFTSDGAARATLMIDLARPEDFESLATRRRIATAERQLLDGTDPWLARFAGLTGGDDGTSWRRTKGALRDFRRWAALEDPRGFAALFADDPVDYSFSRSGDVAALEITPTAASRATRKERERVAREVAAWSDAFSRYVRTVFDLESYLLVHSEERKGCWQRVFELKSDDGGESGAEAEELPTAAQELAGKLSDSLGELLAAFEIDRSDGFSLDERVRKVFHPLTAQLLVNLPVAATEVEGFAAGEPGDDEFGYDFPERSLLAALDELEGRWLVTGPLRAMLDHLRGSPDAAMDITRFIAAPVTKESATPPGATAVADALLEFLRPAGSYRLVWRVPESEAPTS